MLLCILFIISIHPFPLFLSTLPPPPFPGTLHVSTFLPFPSTNTERVSLLWHLRPPSPVPVLVTLQPHSLTHTIAVFTTEYSPLIPITGTHTTTTLSSLSPSTPTSQYLHQPQWDPNIPDK